MAIPIAQLHDLFLWHTTSLVVARLPHFTLAFKFDGALAVVLVTVVLAIVAVLLLRSSRAQAVDHTAPSLVASTLESPGAVTLDSDGGLLVADSAVGAVYRVGADGNLEVVAEGFVEPRGMAVEGEGNLYVADAGAGTVSLITPDGATFVLAETLPGVASLAFGGAGDLLVVHSRLAVPADQSGDNGQAGRLSYSITRISPDGQQTVVADGFLNLAGLAVDGAGNILVAASGFGGSPDAGVGATGPGIYEIAPDGTVIHLLDTGSIIPTGLALSPDGTLFFSGIDGTEAAVYIVAADGSFEPIFTGLEDPPRTGRHVRRDLCGGRRTGRGLACAAGVDHG